MFILNESLTFLIIGAVQGLTEFLPISSSAHLVFFQAILGQGSLDLNLILLLHLGTLLAVLVYFFKDILDLFKGCIKKDSESTKFILAIIIASLPLVAFGLFFSFVLDFEASLRFIATALIIAGFIPVVADIFAENEKGFWKDNFIFKNLFIGFAQIFSIMPGVSRSGMSIAACRLVGLDRKESVKFSFFLSIPAILGGSILSFFYLTSSTEISLSLNLVLALVAAFAVAWFAIHYFLRFVLVIGFVPFAIYHIILAFVIIYVEHVHF